jgi:hypothetical protein
MTQSTSVCGAYTMPPGPLSYSATVLPSHGNLGEGILVGSEERTDGHKSDVRVCRRTELLVFTVGRVAAVEEGGGAAAHAVCYNVRIPHCSVPVGNSEPYESCGGQSDRRREQHNDECVEEMSKWIRVRCLIGRDGAGLLLSQACDMSSFIPIRGWRD